MKGDFILITDENERIRIGYFNSDIINEKDCYEHFSGNIFLNQQLVPPELYSLLMEQQKLVNEGVFSVIDEIMENINSFHIVVDTTGERVRDLYVEGDNGDFKIYNNQIATSNKKISGCAE